MSVSTVILWISKTKASRTGNNQRYSRGRFHLARSCNQAFRSVGHKIAQETRRCAKNTHQSSFKHPALNPRNYGISERQKRCNQTVAVANEDSCQNDDEEGTAMFGCMAKCREENDVYMMTLMRVISPCARSRGACSTRGVAMTEAEFGMPILRGKQIRWRPERGTLR